MKQPKPKKEPHEVTPPTFQMSWAGLPSTIGGPRWGPQMYGMGPTRYPGMTIFQPPLPQATAIPSRLNMEATTMDKIDFSIDGPSSRQKGNSQLSTSHGINW